MVQFPRLHGNLRTYGLIASEPTDRDCGPAIARPAGDAARREA